MTTSAGFLDQAAGRSRTPSGTTPSRARRHSAISSLRAGATINVLRVDGASAVRRRYHRASALSFWNSRNRHAGWIMPCRTRALPERANPLSRRLAPLSSGEPLIAAYLAPTQPKLSLMKLRIRHEKVQTLRLYVEDWTIEHRALPRGKHLIEGLGEINFER